MISVLFQFFIVYIFLVLCSFFVFRADTHLNCCTILSELNRHDQAIIHARAALKLLLTELFGVKQQVKTQKE